MVLFYLGTHKPSWLARTDVPLFVSRRSLEGRRGLPRATCAWALDSGGFTELSMHGTWTLSARGYVELVRRFHDEIGPMDFAAPQDWMCEPIMLQRTGLTVAMHQQLTVDNFIELRSMAPDLPIAPVLQGWEPDDYVRHIAMYDARGVHLSDERVVGVGTVCRRQAMDEAGRIFDRIEDEMRGLQLHGFGFKILGLRKLQHRMASADSLAWSFDARRAPPMEGHTHKSCANCIDYALRWRAGLLEKLGTAAPVFRQTTLL